MGMRNAFSGTSARIRRGEVKSTEVLWCRQNRLPQPEREQGTTVEARLISRQQPEKKLEAAPCCTAGRTDCHMFAICILQLPALCFVFPVRNMPKDWSPTSASKLLPSLQLALQSTWTTSNCTCLIWKQLFFYSLSRHLRLPLFSFRSSFILRSCLPYLRHLCLVYLLLWLFMAALKGPIPP